MIEVTPVYNPHVRDLCCQPYPLHPNGCPNYGKRAVCPPQARLWPDVYNMDAPVYAVVNEFDLGAHVERMRALHPNWSDRQLRCVLYWQGTARKQLKTLVEQARWDVRCQGYRAESCAEAMGINLTATMLDVGIVLEWPPVNVTRQIVLMAKPR